MKCPHCLDAIHIELGETDLRRDCAGQWRVRHQNCPSCNRLMVMLRCYASSASFVETLVLPRASGRTPLPDTVPEPFASDYREACLVIGDSPKASAALSRRCLQALLREKAGVKPGNLADEIQQVLDASTLPSYLADAIDGVRNVGNFAAHAMKSEHTGEVLDVEPGEAEWLLETLEALFDFFFVAPAALAAKQDAVNAKLTAAGKPEMKTSTPDEPGGTSTGE